MSVMTEAHARATTTKPPANPTASAFEPLKHEMAKFDLPKMEVPHAIREIGEKGVAQLKDAYEKAKAAAEDATDLLETTYMGAAKGATDYNLKIIEFARTNTNAAIDYVHALLGVKSPSEFVELSATQTRKQLETATEQTKQLMAFAQKVAIETTEPLKSGLAKAQSRLILERPHRNGLR
jgi:phasin